MVKKVETGIKESSGQQIYFDNLQREKNRLDVQVSYLQSEVTRLAGQVTSLRKLEILAKLTGILNVREIRTEELARKVRELVDTSLSSLLLTVESPESEN